MAGHPRDPRNAPGPFYVVQNQCISCGAPQAEARGLVTLEDGGCYFHKQPETGAEVNDAIRAMLVSCIEVYRYGGTDPAIRRRLAELGHSNLCDHPLDGHPAVLRNHVRFSLDPEQQATEVATRLVAAFEATFKTDGKCTTVVKGDAHRAQFEFTYSAKYATSRRYVVEHVPTLPHPGRLSTFRYSDPFAVRVWFLTEEDGRSTPIWLHDVLLKNGAFDIRWFSRDEWKARADGAELPY